jgi:hypothetical protein
MNDELEIAWEKLVVAYFEVLCEQLSVEPSKTASNIRVTSPFWLEIRTRDLPHTAGTLRWSVKQFMFTIKSVT